MLSSPTRPLRDWLLFGAVALLPTVVVTVLALRATRNEDLAVREQMRLEREQTAARLQQRYDEAFEVMEARLGAHDGEGALPPVPFADAVAFDGGALVEPVAARPSAHASHAPAPDACVSHLEVLAGRTSSQDAAEVRRLFLAECEEATTATGRFAWPVHALDPRFETPVAGETLVRWVRDHAAILSPAERDAVAVEVASTSWLAAEREPIAELLRVDGGAAELTRLSAPRVAALTDQRPESRWREAASAGRLRRLPSGRVVGYVAHDGSLRRTLAQGWPELPPTMTGELVRGAEAPDEAAVTVLPGALHLTVAWRDPDAVAQAADQARMALLAAAATISGLVVALAALLFARVRRERRLSALRTDFVATVSHELRTPIASVRVLSELLATDRVPDDEREELVQVLAAEAERLSTTVDRLLSFSRMQAGRGRVSLARVDVTAVVAEAADVFERLHPAAVKRALDTPVFARVDAEAVRMAVDNLLANAARYAPEGRPYTLSVRRVGAAVEIRCEDRGPGVLARDRERIFEPFVRADDRLSEATEGSGIGLSLVRHVARSHRGRAWVESRPEQGACFVVSLPVREEKER